MPSRANRNSGVGARDMDLLKSLLKNGSTNSDSDDSRNKGGKARSRSPSSDSDCKTKRRSRADSGSSSRSSRSSRSSSSSSRSSKGRKRSGSEDSFWSQGSDEKKKNIKNISKEEADVVKDKSDGEQTPSYEYSSFSSSESESDAKSKDKKVTKKTKKVPKKKLNDSNENVHVTKTCVRIDMGGGKRKDKSHDTSTIKRTPSTTVLDDSDTENIKHFYRKRKKRPTNDLTDRAKQTLHLYPDKLAGPNRLEKTYHALHHMLLEGQYQGKNRQLVKRTKHTLDEYRQHREGFVGEMRPPPGPAPDGRPPRLWSGRRQRPHSAIISRHHDNQDPHRGDVYERTEAEYQQEQKCSKQDCGHVLQGHYMIDTTQPEARNRVCFVQDGEVGKTLFIRRQRSNSFNGIRPASATTNKNTVPKPPRGRGAKRVQRNNKDDPTKLRMNQRSRSTSAHRGYSSGSNTSPSRSRSRSTENRVDHQLKVTDNQRLKDWLKEKNKLLRAERKAERKKLREERKEEMLKEKEKLEKQEKSEEVVNRWMKEKRRHGNRRLLRRQRQGEAQDDDVADSRENLAVEETVKDLNQKELVDSAADEDKCNCGFTEQVLEEEQKEGKTALKLRMEKEAARRSKRPQSGKAAASSKPGKLSLKAKKEEEEGKDSDLEKKRLSYDQWVKQKRRDDVEKRKQERLKRDLLASGGDPETEEVVSGVGRKRVDNILRGRKKIDTGIKSVDEEVNKSMDEKAAEKRKKNPYRRTKVKEVAPSGETSVRYYQWTASENADDKIGNQGKRPVSAHIKSTESPRNLPKRPESAKPTESGAWSTSAVSPGRSRSISPKPKTKPTKAYKQVKYQRRSWDEFSDYVWDKLNEGEGEMGAPNDGEAVAMETRPEPQGSVSEDQEEQPTESEEVQATTESKSGEKDENKDVDENDVEVKTDDKVVKDEALKADDEEKKEDEKLVDDKEEDSTTEDIGEDKSGNTDQNDDREDKEDKTIIADSLDVDGKSEEVPKDDEDEKQPGTQSARKVRFSEHVDELGPAPEKEVDEQNEDEQSKTEDDSAKSEETGDDQEAAGKDGQEESQETDKVEDHKTDEVEPEKDTASAENDAHSNENGANATEPEPAKTFITTDD